MLKKIIILAIIGGICLLFAEALIPSLLFVAPVALGIIIASTIAVIVVNNIARRTKQEEFMNPCHLQEDIVSQYVHNMQTVEHPQDDSVSLLSPMEFSSQIKEETCENNISVLAASEVSMTNEHLLSSNKELAIVQSKEWIKLLQLEFCRTIISNHSMSNRCVPSDIVSRYVSIVPAEDHFENENTSILLNFVNKTFCLDYSHENIAEMIRHFTKIGIAHSDSNTDTILITETFTSPNKASPEYNWEQQNQTLIEKNRRRMAQLRAKFSDYPSVISMQQLRGKISENTSAELFVTIEPPTTCAQPSYSREKIPVKSNKKLAEPYATFEKMRKIGRIGNGYYSYYDDNGDTFYKQALMMQSFTDNYGEAKPFDAYYSSYAKMDDEQLRTYFTWRTKVRQGVIEGTAFSYAFCYLYELINDVGVINAADGINKLISFWTSFRSYSDRIDSYLKDWIRDYYVVHYSELTESFDDVSRRFPVSYRNVDMQTINKAISCSWDDLQAIELSSSFKITNGQFYKSQNAKLIEKCACHVIKSLAKLFKTQGVDFKKMFRETRRERIYSLFRGAVHKTITMSPAIIKIDELETFKFNSRGWYREHMSFDVYRSAVGYIMKCIEVNLRKAFEYKRNLKMPELSQVENNFLNSEPILASYPYRQTMDKIKAWKSKAYGIISGPDFEPAIIAAITEFCKAEHLVIKDGAITVVKPVEIDLSKLIEIQKDYEATAQKLIFHEDELIPEKYKPPMEDKPVPPETPVVVVKGDEAVGIEGLVRSLTDDEHSLLFILLEGGQVAINSEIIIEAINAKALDAIDDNIIDYVEGAVCISDFYFDDLKAAARGKVL